ncbi:hypothetical protein Y717_19480 [Streptomyces scopuliridis RB72]|uniref:Secreted protein n=1 Tax=Streptomyces scopuliridis RB72 TaxID=1440053 RepID=A0A2T7T4E8_9ACTN|nr:hypothetical protein Y717_19480 [Streptomyces scopuliridis RB72]
MSIAMSAIVLAVGVLYAVMPTADSAVPPVPLDAEEGYTYTCYCCPDPVRVTIRAPQAHLVGRAPGGRREVRAEG